MKRLMGMVVAGLFVATSPVHAWGMGGHGGGGIYTVGAPRVPVTIIGGGPGFYERSHQAYPSTSAAAPLVSPQVIGGRSSHVTYIGNGGYAHDIGGSQVGYNSWNAHQNNVQARNDGLWEQGRWARQGSTGPTHAQSSNGYLGGGWYRTGSGSLNTRSSVDQQRTYQRQVGGSAAVLF